MELLIDSVSYYGMMIYLYSVIVLLILVFPLIMWRSYLKEKSMTFRFLFCIITQQCFLCNLVLLLGFLNIISRITLIAGIAVEYAIVRWKTYWRYQPPKERISLKTLKRDLKPESVLKKLNHTKLNIMMRLSKFNKWYIWKWLHSNWFVFISLASMLVYNMLFLNHNILTIGHSYQFSDNPVHLNWIYNLAHGTLFSDGIYPFFMHSMIYIVHTLSGAHLREVVLYYGAFQTLLMITCLYCFAKKLFCNKYVSLMPVLLLSILLRQGRYAASLPQECGVFACMCIAYFMLSFVQGDRAPHKVPSDEGKKAKSFFRINQYLFRYHINTELLLLMLSVNLVIGFHFYTAIAACILIAGFGAVYLPKLLHKQNWVPLLSVGIAGAILAVTPFVACLAKGIKFQESMAWATSVITGETWVNDEESSYKDMFNEYTGSDESGGNTSASDEGSEDGGSSSLAEKLELYKTALEESDVLLFGTNSHKIELICMACCGLALVLAIFIKPLRKPAQSYLVLCVYALIVTALGEAKLLGIINIIDAARAGVFLQPFMVILFSVPVDIVLRIVKLIKFRRIEAIVSLMAVCACVFSGFWFISNGWYHSYFDLNQMYYNEVDYVLKHIRKTMPDKSFTVVSPTDDYYAVVDEGYHTELSEFMNMVDGNEEEFVIPSEYVFFVVEKKILQDYTYGRVYVDPKSAAGDMLYMRSSQDYYYQRLAIESKAYYWSRAMLKTYPNNFTVYFENDIIVVYLLRQNTYYPYSLKIDYKSDLPDIGLAEELGISYDEQ